MSNLYSVPLNNAVQRSLGNTLNQGETATITFSTSVSGVLQASASMPGLLVIDRVDANGTPTPSLTEYISFTGVSGSTVTGLTRGLAGTSDIAHSVGSIVEFVPDVTWANAINNTFTEQHNADGTHKANAFSTLASTTIQSSNIDSFSFKNINAPEGFLINGRINVTSGASLSLSLSLQTLNGSNPTTTNPIYVRIGDNVRTVSSPLTLNLPAGTNYFNSGASELTGQEIDYFVYLGDANGDVRLGFGRIPFARRFEDYNTTNTDEKHISFTSLLTTNQNCVNIGRFPATLTGTARTWSIPTLTATNLINRPSFDSRILSFTPQYTGFSTAPTYPMEYKIIDNRIFVYQNNTTGANGTSNSTAFTFTLPFMSKNLNFGYQPVFVVDNGTNLTTPGNLQLNNGSSVATVFRSFYNTAFTNTGAKVVHFGGLNYQI